MKFRKRFLFVKFFVYARTIAAAEESKTVVSAGPSTWPQWRRGSNVIDSFRLRFGSESLKIWIVAQRVRPERGKRAAELPGKANALHQILKSPIRTDGFELRRNVQINKMERVLRIRFFQ
jgi:hypothetical protein